MRGADFAKAFDREFKASDVAAVAERTRRELLIYLRNAVPELNSCTDMVLVDLGYAATVQKALRKIFDLAGIQCRLHGLYLLTLDDTLRDIAPNDSAEGFISDLIITPHVKRALLRNVVVLEQLCCAPQAPCALIARVLCYVSPTRVRTNKSP